jgi:hypothetical protein
MRVDDKNKEAKEMVIMNMEDEKCLLKINRRRIKNV